MSRERVCTAGSSRRRVGVRSGIVLTVLVAPMARAATDTYVGPSGNWSTAGNWSLGHAPAAGDAVTLTNGTNASVVVAFDAAAPSIGSGLSSLVIDGSTGGVATLGLPVGATNALAINGTLFAGLNGSGQVTQAGGAVSAAAISLADNAKTAGSYALSGGSLNLSSDFNVGRAGTGSFTMIGGTFTGPNFLIGTLDTGSGTVNISGGQATANDVWVGGYYGDIGGNGVLTVSGTGKLNVPGTLTLYNGANNRFNLNGGTVTAGALDFDGNLGRFQWTAGALNVTGSAGLLIDPGSLNGSSWHIDLPGQALNVTNTLTIGRSGDSSLTQTNGVVTAGALNLGANGASPTAYTLTFGTATFGTAVIGGTATATHNGTVAITGGSFNVAGTLDVAAGGVVSQSGGALAAGALVGTAGATNTVGISPGALTLVGRNEIVGAASNPDLFIGGDQTFVSPGTGAATLGSGGLLVTHSTTVGAGNAATFTQTGGTHTATYVYVGYGCNGVYSLSGGSLSTGNLYLGQGFAPNGSGTFNLSGGAHLTAGSSQIDGDTFVGYTGAGVFNNNGGVHDTLILYLGNQPGSSGLYNLADGSTLNIAVDEIVGEPGIGGAAGTFNQYGGAHSIGRNLQFLSGKYLLAGGSVSTAAGGLFVAPDGANAAFTQTGGLLSVNTAGTPDTGTLIAGYLGTASFAQSGGTHHTSLLALGFSPGTVGTYSLINGSLAVDRLLGVGAFPAMGGSTFYFGGQGQFSQYGGTTTVGNAAQGGIAYVSGYGAAGTGTPPTAGSLSLYGGRFSVLNGPLNVGNFGSATVNLGSGAALAVGTDLVLSAGPTWSTTFMQTGGTNQVGGSLLLSSGATYTQTGGTLAATAATLDGSFSLMSGSATLGAITGTGPLSVGGAGSPATLTVTRFSQNAVTIGDGGRLNVLPAALSATNTAGALAISGTGQLDLANHHLVTATPAGTIRQYLASAYAGGNWTGNGITSSTASANNAGAVKKYALGYAAAGQPNVVPTIPAGSVLVRPTLLGDTNLDGKVDNNDISAVIAGGHYLDGTATNGWAVGDWNYDGKVDNADISALVASGNYLSGQTVDGPTPPAAHASAKLTSASVTAASSTVGVSGDGVPDYVYDPVSGDVRFIRDGLPGAIQEVHVRSATAQINPAAIPDPSVGANGLDVTGTSEIDLFRQGSSGATLRQFPDGYDLGDILPGGLTDAALLQDLTLTYTVNGGGTSNVPATLIYGSGATPEPTCLALLGIAAIGLFGQRSRRRLS